MFLLLLSLLLLFNVVFLVMLQNPIQFIFFLILMFLYGSGLLLLLEQEFLALLLIVVYIGAVAVLFLFVVMMLNIKSVDFSEDFYKYFTFGGCVSIILFMIMNVVIDLNFNQMFVVTLFTKWMDFLNNTNTLMRLGDLLYTYYGIYTIIAGMVLLLAMFCAIELSLDNFWKSYIFVKKQDIYTQLKAKKSLNIIMLKKK